jgi:hypothetical protein
MLRRELIVDARQARTAAEGLMHLLVHIGFLIQVEKQLGPYVALQAYLQDIGVYIRDLRPKPEFRNRKNFDAIRRSLNARWRFLKARLGLLSWLGV